MDMKENNNPHKRPKSVFLSWDSNGKIGDNDKVKLKSQNNMGDHKNIYAHTTLPNNPKDGVNNDTNTIGIINRGNNNVAPQMDLQLGRRSITHKKIAEGVSTLVAGKGIEFRVKEKNILPEGLTQEQELQLEIANGFLEIGLSDCLPILANGATYFSLSSLYVAQKPAKFVGNLQKVAPTPLYFTAVPSQELRFGVPKMNEQGRVMIDKHVYHPTWGFTGDNCKDNTIMDIGIIPISEYIIKSNKGELNTPTVSNPYAIPPAFWIDTMNSYRSALKPFISHAILSSVGIFDNAYPLPEWKTDTSINYIQGEAEASNVCIDYLRNGLHIFAIVNVYSKSFGITTANEGDGNEGENWAESLEVIQNLRKSYNSGKLLVNPVYTDDASKDGKIEIEELKLTFPVDAVRFFNEESRSSILTAWGVMADLFGISKPEKNNLRSQEGFLQLGIILLQEKVGGKQHKIEQGINELLEYYGITEVEAHILPKDNSAYIVVMKDFAAQYMDFNEVRTEILRKSPYTQEEKDNLAMEMATLKSSLKQQGVTVVDNTNNIDNIDNQQM